MCGQVGLVAVTQKYFTLCKEKISRDTYIIVIQLKIMKFYFRSITPNPDSWMHPLCCQVAWINYCVLTHFHDFSNAGFDIFQVSLHRLHIFCVF